MDRRVIAIDGPSGAGKSSVSKRVGKELGFLHVDSGALYRIMTWQCLVRGVDTSDPAAVAACAAAVEVESPARRWWRWSAVPRTAPSPTTWAASRPATASARPKSTRTPHPSPP